MSTLITCVGNTDPIRNFHDGPILHIARKYRPEKIIFIYSEGESHKKERVEKAILSIDGYHPIFEYANIELKDDDVWKFDTMFEQISMIFNQSLSTEEDIILNLTSGTGAMNSAFFAINRIDNFNVKAIQVITPERKSNEGIQHDNNENIDILIETNEDNVENFEDRCHEDESKKFTESLEKMNIETLIKDYDYQGSIDLINRGSYKNDKLLKELKEVSIDIKQQRIPNGISKMVSNKDASKALAAYLVIDFKYKQGNVSDVLIRLTSLVEFSIERYLKRKYPEMLMFELKGVYYNENYDRNLYNQLKYDNFEKVKMNIDGYYNILDYEGERELASSVNDVNSIKNARNQVAHNLDTIRDTAMSNLKYAVPACKKIIKTVFNFDDKVFNYYDDLNKKFIDML